MRFGHWMHQNEKYFLTLLQTDNQMYENREMSCAVRKLAVPIRNIFPYPFTDGESNVWTL